MIHLIIGPQGAGKSTYAKKLSLCEQAVYFSIDSYMAQLFGQDMPQPLDLDWVLERVGRCQKLIWATAVEIVRNSGVVVLDTGLMKNEDRIRIKELADEQGLAMRLHFVNAPLELRQARVLNRNQSRDETFSFEVSPEMFSFMEAQFEYPSEGQYPLIDKFMVQGN